MAKTRSATKSYRRRLRNSKCRGKSRKVCGTLKKCKYTKGQKSYCRKSRNTRRRNRTQRRRRRGGSGVLGRMAVPALLGTGLRLFSKRKRRTRYKGRKSRFSKRK